MNAARALLLPRGNPRRRMPLWLQRLKAADLLQAVREFPSFPIVVETYRDVLQDAFDLDGLRDVLSRLSSGTLGMRQVATEMPSPFARALQFGFVMDWMYGDDTPRAEARAALLSLDRALLDELMGGQGADETTLAVLAEVLERRRGTASGWQARDADELAVLVDRAGDVTREELIARVAPAAEWRRGDPIQALLASGRLLAADLFPGARRFLLVDTYARYAAAFGKPLQGSSFQPRKALPERSPCWKLDQPPRSFRNRCARSRSANPRHAATCWRATWRWRARSRSPTSLRGMPSTLTGCSVDWTNGSAPAFWCAGPSGRNVASCGGRPGVRSSERDDSSWLAPGSRSRQCRFRRSRASCSAGST
jgi:hypothetical protein